MTAVVTSVPLALAIVAPWMVPESARWLVSQGRIDEAVKIMRKMEKANGTHVPETIYKRFQVHTVFPIITMSNNNALMWNKSLIIFQFF